MSIEVAPTGLGEELSEDSSAFVACVGQSGAVKLTHCRVDLADSSNDGVVLVELGPGGLRNLNERPAATLLWPSVRSGFSLLADGRAVPTVIPESGRGWIAIAIESAVLHKAPLDASSA